MRANARKILVTYACYPGEWHLSRKVCHQTSSSLVTQESAGEKKLVIISADIIEENRDVEINYY